MIDDEDYTKYDIMYNLCVAEASNETISAASERLDVLMATTLKACPQHAKYGHAYISHELPQGAYIVIGEDHITQDDNAGRGVGGIITPEPSVTTVRSSARKCSSLLTNIMLSP